jgi:aryl-alcohol dehydrogenase-like predicted oxidoreductase
MLFTNLGRTGLVVSKLALGTMTFGSGRGRKSAGVVSKLTQDGADRLVAAAIDAGVNHFNSADVYSYGESEEMLGRSLGSRRSRVVISTKGGFRTGAAPGHAGLSRGHLIRAVDESLQRLGTDYIDIYLAHVADPFTPIEETLEAFDTLVRSGKVRYPGFSNWPAWFAATAMGIQQSNGYVPFCAAEMYYSLIGRDVELEFVPFAKRWGVGLLVWSPLTNGFLSGKYTRQDPTGGGGRLTGFDQIPFDREKGYDVVDILREIAERIGESPAAIAMAWLLARPQVASILVGASSEQQLQQNLRAASVTLSTDDMARLNAVAPPTRTSPHWLLEEAGDEVRAEMLGDGPDFDVPPAAEHRRWRNWGKPND